MNLDLKTQTQIRLTAIAVLLIFALALVFSQNANPSFPPLFGLKRVQEKVFLKLKSKPEDRLEYMTHLLNNRLGELSALVNNKNYTFILPSSLRYSSLAGEVTDYTIAINSREIATETKKMFEKHKKALDDLYAIYPKNLPDNEEWKYIKDDYNYLNLYLTKLEESKL